MNFIFIYLISLLIIEVVDCTNNQSYSLSIISSNQQSWKSIVSSSSGQFVYIAASYGYIYKSYDYLETVNISNSIIRSYNSLATSESGQYVAATAYNSSLFISTDYGVDWNEIDSVGSKYWIDLSMSSDGQYIYFISKNDNIYMTKSNRYDISISNYDNKYWKSISTSSSGEYVYVVVQNGYIYCSYNYGESWNVCYSTNLSWKAISTSKSGKYVYSCVFGEYIYKSTDYGNTWQISSTINSFWNTITLINDGDYVYVNDRLGRIYQSNVNSSTWSKVYDGDQIWTSITASTDNKYVYMTAFEGNIYELKAISYPTSSPTFILSTPSPSIQVVNNVPTVEPSYVINPTGSPTIYISPTVYPTDYSSNPSSSPTISPSTSSFPTVYPSEYISSSPTISPTISSYPTVYPSEYISSSPTISPTISSFPTTDYTSNSTTSSPTKSPTISPSKSPSTIPTIITPTYTPTYLPTYTNSASYVQYIDRLRINFNVTIPASYVYNENYCLTIPTAYTFTTTYFISSFYETYLQHKLNDLEIYFLPTSEYIGNDYGGYATTQLSSWPSSYQVSSNTSVDSGTIVIDITGGFNQVCFANNCGRATTSCQHSGVYNGFIGYIDLFGITINSPTAFPTIYPTNNIESTSTPSTFIYPTTAPINSTSSSPTIAPSVTPSTSNSPSNMPSVEPSKTPSTSPSNVPTLVPSTSPTKVPSNEPSKAPTTLPTKAPTILPSASPSSLPTVSPSNPPTELPSFFPTDTPINLPTINPTNFPTDDPTDSPIESSISTYGLVAHIDFTNPSSYSGSGSSYTNLVDNLDYFIYGNSYSTNTDGTLRLDNSGSGCDTSATGIYYGINGVYTVSLWVKSETSNIPACAYLIDARDGISQGYCYGGGAGAGWSEISFNGGPYSAVSNACLTTLNVGEWTFITLVTYGLLYTDIHFFSRYTETEGFDCSVKSIYIYSEYLDEETNYNNFISTFF